MAANAVWPARATSSACSRLVACATALRSAPTAKMNGLPVMPTACDLACLGPGAQGLDRGREALDRPGSEGVGLGVVETVVQGDEGQHAGVAGEGDVAHRGVGHDLVERGGGRLLLAHAATSLP